MPVIVVTCFDYVARQCVALIPGCQAVHTPQYTNYGYNNAAGDDESKMVAEGTKLCINQILAARPRWLLTAAFCRERT